MTKTSNSISPLPPNNDVNENSRSHTPSASRAIASIAPQLTPLPRVFPISAAAAAAAPSTPNIIQGHTHSQQQQQQQQQSSPIPPVAVLLQREGSSPESSRNSITYSYPVATLLSNVIRSVSENVRSYPTVPSSFSQYIDAAIQPALDATKSATVTATSSSSNVPNDNNDDSTNTDDVVDGTNSGTTAGKNTSIATVPASEALQSSRTAASNFESDNQVWSLIDGELVARLDDNEDYEDENDREEDDGDHNSRSNADLSFIGYDYMEQHDCQKHKGSRIQRGVRKFKKLRNILGGRAGQRRNNDRNIESKSDDSSKGKDRNFRYRDYANQCSDSQRNKEKNNDGIIDRDHELLHTAGSDDGFMTIISNDDDDNSTIISNNKCHAGEVPTLTGSMRSNASSNTTNSKGLRKKNHRFKKGWLVRGNVTNSSSRSNLSTTSSSSSQSLLRKKFQNQSSSSIVTGLNDTRLKGSTPANKKEPPATTDPLRGISMPPLHETSRDFSCSSNHQKQPPLSSFVAQSSLSSPLHAPPIISNSREGLLAAPLPNLTNPDSLQLNTSISAHASFVENADVLSASMIAAECFVENRLDSDFKVDKKDAPSIDNWLQQAGEFTKDLEAQDDDQPSTPIRLGKSDGDGESIPLSYAHPDDKLVHNDILKIVLVGDNAVDKSGLGRLLRKSTREPRKRKEFGVDVHTWAPTDNFKFNMWEVQASKSSDLLRPNFGARPGTQSLFFSDRSLYLLVWDMGANNSKTFPPSSNGVDFESEDEDDSEDEDHMNAYHREQANLKAERALHTDIHERVLSWVDCVARRGSHSAILPIALVPPHMAPEEAKRRCQEMQTLIKEHTERNFLADVAPPKVLCGPETVICVSLDTNMGLGYLEEMILEIADPTHNVFDHVGRPVPEGTVQVMECCRRLKSNSHKLILVDHLLAELPNASLSVEVVMQALEFLSNIGQLIFFGGSDSMLNHYVILNRRWLVRNDLERELSETRRFMNIQSLYSNQRFQESNVTKTFAVNNSSCPVLSSEDTQMLWQSMTFMVEAVDRSSELSEDCQTVSTIFSFLEHLLVHTGIFMPLEIDPFCSAESVYFVPSLLSQESAKDVWTYKSSESWMTTLCHSWLFRDGAPLMLMEKVTVALLRDLYESSHATVGKSSRQGMDGGVQPKAHPRLVERAQTFGGSSLTHYIGSHDREPIDPIKIHQIVCWKNSMLIKIGELREAFIEVFVAVTDQASPHTVASDAMRSNMQRLVVSVKGQEGFHGQKLWNGGYNIVLDSIKASVANHTNVERQVVCPECLAHDHAQSASTWSWDSVRAASDSVVHCTKGHKVDRNMICGTLPSTVKDDGGRLKNVNKKHYTNLLPCVVVVGLWNDERKAICQVGSGFIVNRKHGLIVTAGHTLFNMDSGCDFGDFLFGIKNARVVIGVIPGNKENDETAVFRYFAEIVAEDIHNIDACVLRITSKLETDVADATLISEHSEKPIEDFLAESFQSMKLTSRYELEQSVRLIGFNQGGEGMLEKGKHINRSVEVVQGYICKHFILSDDHSLSSGDSSSSEGAFAPREEIVLNNCPTINGHSGGACINDEGKVIGILSRADPVDRGRCYLVPSSEIKTLINKAKKQENRRNRTLI